MRIASLHTYPIKGCHRLDHDAARVEPWGLADDRRWLIVDGDGVGITQRTDPRLTGLRPLPHPDGLTLRAAGRADLAVTVPAAGPKLDVRVFRSLETVPARRAAPAADAWLSEWLTCPARLVWLADPTVRPIDRTYGTAEDRVGFADAYPILLANAASLAMLNDWIRDAGDEPVPMNRFRPNIVVTGAPAWVEDDWLGRRLRIGDTVLRAVKPCARCLVTTIDQETGDTGRQPLRALGIHRRHPLGLLFGLNLIPDPPHRKARSASDVGCGTIRVGDDLLVLPEGDVSAGRS